MRYEIWDMRYPISDILRRGASLRLPVALAQSHIAPTGQSGSCGFIALRAMGFRYPKSPDTPEGCPYEVALE
jgi:hypothetical protein